MPGLYLLAILLSAGGVALLDRRFRLAFWGGGGRQGRRTAATVALGTVFFLLWDAAGILSGIFVRGDSPLLLGIDLAPHLPVEEVAFLAFLSYLALVLHGAALRARTARAPGPRAPGEPQEEGTL